jgi:hypothetical protein
VLYRRLHQSPDEHSERAPGLSGQRTETWAVSVDPAEGEKGKLRFRRALGLSSSRSFPMRGEPVYSLRRGGEPQQLASRMSVLIDKDGMCASSTKR